MQAITNVLSPDAKQALILAAIPKLEAAVKKGKQTVKIPADMATSPALKDKVTAKISLTGYGADMAKDYLASLGSASATWQTGVVYLLKTASDKDRAKALQGAVQVAKACKDETAKQSLMKRISEARRVFAAATVKGQADVIKVFAGKGSWHQKVTSLPKAGKAGRPKGAAKTPVATVEQAMASVAAAVKPGHEKNHEVQIGVVVEQIKQLSTAKMLLLVDVIAFELSKSANIYEQGCGKQIMQFRDRQEAAVLKAVAA